MTLKERLLLLTLMVEIPSLHENMPLLHEKALIDYMESWNGTTEELSLKMSDVILIGKLTNALRQMKERVPDWEIFMDPNQVEPIPTEWVN